MTIYNLFPLLAGEVRHWKPHLQRAADMGFDWVFVNPIQFPGFSGSLLQQPSPMGAMLIVVGLVAVCAMLATFIAGGDRDAGMPCAAQV